VKLNDSERHQIARQVIAELTGVPERDFAMAVRSALVERELEGDARLAELIMAGRTGRTGAGDGSAMALGPFGSLLTDPEVRDIAVNGIDDIWVMRGGTWEPAGLRFSSEDELRATVDRLVAATGRSVALTREDPIVDGRIAGGARPRISAIIPPAADGSLLLTIRVYRSRYLPFEELIRRGSMTPDMGIFLQAAIRARLNIIVSGGTGSGKTTMLGSILGRVPNNERLVLIEDTPEITLYAESPSVSEERSDEWGDYRVPAATPRRNAPRLLTDRVRDADAMVRTSLRMSPDRIVVGEVRGKEALSMLQAMNTGHEGSISTIHANAPVDVVSRLETLALAATDNLPYGAIRAQIAAAIDLVVHVARTRGGRHLVTEIAEVRPGVSGPEVATIFRHGEANIAAMRAGAAHRPETRPLPATLARLEDAWPQSEHELFEALSTAAS
jgi:pilus assembly protein CpaF